MSSKKRKESLISFTQRSNSLPIYQVFSCLIFHIIVNGVSVQVF